MTALDKLIARLVAVFGEPKTPRPEMFLDEFRRAVDGYAPEVYPAAANEIIATSTFWPKPAEVRKIADRIATARFRPAPLPPADDLPPPSPESVARARALVAEATKAIAAGSPPTIAPKPWRDTSRPAFEAMQRNSPNRALHIKPIVLKRGGAA